MESVLEQLEPGSRVAVLRLRSLGDCVLTTPALEVLKRSRPDLRVAVVVERRFQDVLAGHPDVQELLPPKLGALRRWRPGLCVNFHGGTRSAWLTALSGARYRAGFGHFRHGFVYNVRIPRAQEILRVDRKVHTAEHLASAMFYLGAERCEVPPAKLGVEGRVDRRARSYAVIHPFATGKGKAWPAERFQAVAEHLIASGIDPVVIGSTDDFENHPSWAFVGQAFGPAAGLSAGAPGRSPAAGWPTLSGAPLSEIKRLLAGASLFIGNDSGPAHMAAAFGLPVVVLFGASDPDIWRPWRTPCEVLTASDIHNIEVSQVLDAVARLRVHA